MTSKHDFFYFLFSLVVCCLNNVGFSSSPLLSFVKARFEFSCWCCRFYEGLKERRKLDKEESPVASDKGSWYTVSDWDSSNADDDDDDDDDDGESEEDSSDGGSKGVEDGFTLLRCRRRVRNGIESDADSDNNKA